MPASTTLADLLRAPLDGDWTVERLAETVLGAVAEQPPVAGDFVFVLDDSTERQSRRLIRPLLAYLATASAGEAGTPVELYGGQLAFQRLGPAGPVWVLGEFENRPGSVRLTLRRSESPAPAWHLDEVRRRVAVADADPTASIPLEELRRDLT